MLTILLAAFIPLLTNDTFNIQCHMDAAGFSVNTIDGTWGIKSRRAKELYLKAGGTLSAKPYPMKLLSVTQEDLNELVDIPDDPEEKADLEYLGYKTIKEMYAEKGHVSQKCLAKLNPEIINWSQIQPGTLIRIPDFDFNSAAGKYLEANRNQAALVKISLSRCEVCVYNKEGHQIAFFPCSIAASKAKLPPHGELKITSLIENPNYTYTPDEQLGITNAVKRYIYEPGPNNPVGIAWIGLNLPGYGIHGTPIPERVGNAESHGCFRLANWNAYRLFKFCTKQTRVLVEP